MAEENDTDRDTTTGRTRRSSSTRSSRPSSRDRRYRGRRRWSTGCTPRCPGYKGERVTYKQAELLKQFVTDRGKIRPRRQTGACAKHQRMLARAIKRARYIALLPFIADHVFT